MNETYTAFMRGRLPKYEKPKVERIDHLSASVIVDQSRLLSHFVSLTTTISGQLNTRNGKMLLPRPRLTTICVSSRVYTPAV